MTDHISINAVLANNIINNSDTDVDGDIRHSYRQRQQQQQHQQQQQQQHPQRHRPLPLQNIKHQDDDPDRPHTGSSINSIPLSPTSGNFSWPARVRSPEPHVPLRKASPERLHSRRSPAPAFAPYSPGLNGSQQSFTSVPMAPRAVTHPLKAHPVTSPVAPPRSEFEDFRRQQREQRHRGVLQYGQLDMHGFEEQKAGRQQEEEKMQEQEQEQEDGQMQVQEQEEEQTWHQGQQQREQEHEHEQEQEQEADEEQRETGRESTRHSGMGRDLQTQRLRHRDMSMERLAPTIYSPPARAHTHDENWEPKPMNLDPEGSRKASWPLAFGAKRGSARHSQNNSPEAQRKPGQLRTSQSMTEVLRGGRESIPRSSLDSQSGPGSSPHAHGYRRGRAHGHHHAHGHGHGHGHMHGGPLRDTPSLPEDALEEVRTSFRSALTSNSSHLDSTSVDTARSSILTADSSVSESLKLDNNYAPSESAPEVDGHEDRPSTGHKSEHFEGEDVNFTVEDALDMYIAGFDTPSRRSFDSRRGSFPRLSISRGSLSRSSLSRSSFIRGSIDNTSIRLPRSLGEAAKRLTRQINAERPGMHRRSQSAGISERLQVYEDVQNIPLPRVGRTSTQPVGPVGNQSSPHIPDLRSKSISPARGKSPSRVAPPIAPPRPKPVPRDRYGFKKASHHVTLEQYDAWEKSYNEHLERRKHKWDILMRQHGLSTDNPTRFPPRSDKVKRYIRKGIPPEWRGNAWFFYADGPRRLKASEGLYEKLCEKFRLGELRETDREHIERDLNRTFPDNIRFKPDDATPPLDGSAPQPDEPESDMVASLRRVLSAFAIHNPAIGYCQSLNFIAGLLLLFLDGDESRAFILLNVVTNEHLPGTHGVALEGANIDIAVLMSSIRESLPHVWNRLDDRATLGGVAGDGQPGRLPTVSLATTAWFMSLFVGTLPIESVLRVWDCLFFEGSKTLFRVALAIFRAGEPQIRSVQDPMEIFQVVQTLPRGMIDANALLEGCFRKRAVLLGAAGLRQDEVEKRREERRKDVRDGKGFAEESEGSHSPRLGVGKLKLARTRSKSFRKHRLGHK